MIDGQRELAIHRARREWRMAGETFELRKIGDARITKVVEFGRMATPPVGLLDLATTDLVFKDAWIPPEFADKEGNLSFSTQTFVVEAAGPRGRQ